MRVREILDAKGRGVVTVRPEASVSTVVHRLVLERIGALVVSEDGRHIAGVVTESDIVRALAADGAAAVASGRRVAELMTRNVATCTPEDTVKRVMAEMTRRRVRHLPVVEGGGLRQHRRRGQEQARGGRGGGRHAPRHPSPVFSLTVRPRSVPGASDDRGR